MVLELAARPEDADLSAAGLDGVDAGLQAEIDKGDLAGAVTLVAVFPFAHIGVAHLWAVAYFGLGAALLLGLVGIFTGLWSEKFDHLAAVTNFVIMPMTFLSGTFYLVDRLPEPFRAISHYNPFFYMIDGFRYGFIGAADGSLVIGVAVVAVLNLILAGACWTLFHTGYRLRT